MTKKEYIKFIDKLFNNTSEIYNIYIIYYDKITSKIVYKVINSPRGIIGEPYVNQLNRLIGTESIFDVINPNTDIEINGNNILFHCGKKIRQKQEKILNGIKYSGMVTVGYETYSFSINSKYIVKYHIN